MEKKLTHFRIGGVPEHFNFPWKCWLEHNDRKCGSAEWTWQDFPGGSGAMISAVLEGQIDLALVLTESAANAIMQGADIKLLAVFVESPLVWGIFSGADNPVEKVSPVQGKKYAISRFGSGSHLMAGLDAGLRGESLNDEQFLVVGGLDGARDALVKQEADLFFWEKWMTKPLADQGVLKMIDERPTPWSCFVLICRPALWENHDNRNLMMQAFEEVLETARKLKNDFESASRIAAAYGLSEADTGIWLGQTTWASRWQNPEEEINKAFNALNELRRNKIQPA
jgi:ABC-type nitrate/sulfonate/bicarbonate transport system substrate-binding protein